MPASVTTFSTILLAFALAANAGTAAAQGAAGDFAAARLAARELPRLQSLLVSRDGELVLEEYFNGTDPRRPANMKSASKSVISALVGIAIDEGFIDSVSAPVAQFFPEYIDDDSARAAITVENLLTMESGLKSTSNRNYGRWVLSDNWVRFALEQPLVAEPGTRMLYSTGSTHLLSAILTRATGMDTRSFAQRYLTEPLGFSMSYWSRDPQGIYFGGNDMEWTPRQMLAFGELYRNRGEHGGERVLPAEWVARSHQPHARSPRGQGRFYGYGWWLRDLAGMQVPVAWGYGGQLIFVSAPLELVIVATSDSEPGGARRGHLARLYDLVEMHILLPERRKQGFVRSGD